MKTALLAGFTLTMCIVLLVSSFIIGSRLLSEPSSTIDTLPETADALFNTVCIPKIFEDSDQYGSTASATICSDCSGWITKVRIFNSAGDEGGNARISLDGSQGDQLSLGGSRVGYDNDWFFMSRFNENITYTLTDSSPGWIYMAVSYCEE